MKPIFEVRHLSAGYDHAVVSDISFAVFPGEVVGILGRNGHGKTTLLRGITGDAKRFSGEIFINGQDCTSLAVKQQAAFLSVLPQRTQILEGITVQEILKMGCYPRHGFLQAISDQDQIKVMNAAERLGIADLLEQDCSKLSQGQQQMVLLCRMLIQDTPVMLLDEPDGALDYSNKHLLFQILHRLVREEKKAGVLVLHDPEAALRWCDRLLILNEGVLLRDVNVSLAGEQLQEVLQILYPDIQVRKNPFHKGFLCYLQE